jgi:hypothetical protein
MIKQYLYTEKIRLDWRWLKSYIANLLIDFCFVWMKNNAKEAKSLWLVVAPYKGIIDYVAMDPKAADYDLYR